MDATLNKEKELNEKLVENVKALNIGMSQSLAKELLKNGISPNKCIGGLMSAFCSNEMDLERNINNLFAAFSNNFAESIFFQVDNIKKTRTMEIIDLYLSSKGLSEDFAEYRMGKKNIEI